VDQGKHATTHVRPVEQLTGATLVQCTLETGRTHQIRVHLADHHHAVLGDHMYGRTPKDPVAREAAQLIGRQALHAAVLGFVHPTSGETLRFEREPPDDFQAALTHLRA
jgi:23S rRNA pseudouridine1911/1915/1917 synthase